MNKVSLYQNTMPLAREPALAACVWNLVDKAHIRRVADAKAIFAE